MKALRTGENAMMQNNMQKSFNYCENKHFYGSFKLSINSKTVHNKNGPLAREHLNIKPLNMK